MIRKVTDEAKKVKNVHLRKVMADQGIDADYVELVQDYAPNRVNGKIVKGRSQYARFYKDRKSNKTIAEFSLLPHATDDGQKIECGWYPKDGKYYSKPNLFSAVIDGGNIKVTALSDQPSGAKSGDFVEWTPQLFLDGIEQPHGLSILLATDPMNTELHNNVVEWDYGICKRRIRIIEGRIRERWVFAVNPNGEVRVKHNHAGALRLKLGKYGINDDEELIPVSAFDEAEYPFMFLASPETFYCISGTAEDAGLSHEDNGGLSWGDITSGVGTGEDDGAQVQVMQARNDAGDDMYDRLNRLLTCFLTAAIPDTDTVTGVVFSVYGFSKADANSDTPNMNVYSSSPANVANLAAGDFDSFGSQELATSIAYAAINTAGYNDLTLIDVGGDDFATNDDGTYINKAGTTTIGIRNANYDVAVNAPVWDGSGGYSFVGYCCEEGGTTKDPKLVVTYEAPLIEQAVGDGSIAIAGSLGLLTKIGVGGGSISIAGTLGRVIKISVGEGSIAISGALSAIKRFLVSVGGGSVAIAGTLSPIKRFLQSVGGGSIAITGTLGRLIKISVGGGSIAISGALTTIKTIFQNVGGGSVAIAGTLGRKISITVGQGAVAIAGGINWSRISLILRPHIRKQLFLRSKIVKKG